jgi:cell division protein FtsZ
MTAFAETVVVIVVIGLAVVLTLRIAVAVPGWVRRTRRPESRAIRVIGIGGGGSNAVDRMVTARIQAVSFVACNTDAQALRRSSAGIKIRIGDAITHGLGSGGDPEIGRRAAEENRDEIARALAGADLVFVTAGLGGGTGSGAGPIVAACAKDQGALTVAVVTKPFGFEGSQRQRIADAAAQELRSNVDALIVIPNDRVSEVLAEDTLMLDAFRVVDDVLLQAVKGIIDLITTPGLINLDFADIRTVMKDAGPALIGLGRGSGEHRATDAARQAVASPLLENAIDGAHGIVFNISGPPDLRLGEVRLAADVIRARADVDANVIFGATFGGQVGEDVLITLIATGLNGQTLGEAADPSTPVEEPENGRPAKAVEPTRPPRRPPRDGRAAADPDSMAAPAALDRPERPKMLDEGELDVPTFMRRRQPPTGRE